MAIDRINIGNKGIDEQLKLDRVQSSATAKSSSQAERPAAANDSLELSARAKEIDRVSRLVEDSENHSAHIERVREAIQVGTYRVSSEAIAQKLIDLNKKE